MEPSPPASPRAIARRRVSVEVKYGYPRRTTADNGNDQRPEEQFPVPVTRTVWQTMFNASALSTWILWSMLVAEVGISLSGKLSRPGHILQFLFWRLSYNVGLGVVLRWQSNDFWVSNLWRKHILEAPSSSLLKRVMFGLVREQIPDRTVVVHKLNPDLCAWLSFRFLVDIILCSDVMSYVLLVVNCAHSPTQVGVWELLQYFTGFAMAAFNFWAKLDAHRCIGDYAWYWGDFFFRIEQHLTFDGIFELFPHPMYTVGYAFFYGFAMISRSYTVLFVSLIAHLMQLTFLVLVENPHIDKTYGSTSGGVAVDPEVFQILYISQGGKEVRDSSVLLWNLDFLSIADIATLVSSLYSFVLCWYLPEPWNLIHCVFCRLAHWAVVSFVLVNQSASNWWVKLFERRGHSRQHAFSTWKHLYNYTSTVNMFVFVGTALQFTHGPLSVDASGNLRLQLANPRDIACILVGFVLICINGWAYRSMYNNLGDFGWYYGDFFIPPRMYKPSVSYSGVYRFLNNPDCVIGYAGLHGLALMVRSWRVFGMALMFQALSVLFVNLVEVPHMDMLYERRQLRKETPLEVALRDKLPHALKEKARQVRQQAAQEIFQLYSKLAPPPATICLLYDSPSEAIVGEALTVKFKTSKNHSNLDWVGLYDVNSPSAPGFSKGCWVYVPSGKDSGTLTFEGRKTPSHPGVFQFRYHLNGSYEVSATSSPILVQEDPDRILMHDPALEDETDEKKD